MANIRDWEQDDKLALLKSWTVLSKKEIAAKIGIDRTTLNRWAKKSLKIYNALCQGDAENCGKVESSAEKSCHDRTVIETVERQLIGKDGFPVKDAEGNPVFTIERRTRVIPGDPRAQQYYLERRNPNRWPEAVKPEDDGNKNDVIGFIPAPEVMEEPAQDGEGL